MKRTLPCGPLFWVRTQEESEVLPVAKTSSLNKEQKEQKEKREHLKGEVGHSRKDTGTRMKRYRIFKTVLLHIYLGRHGLTVLADSCKFITRGSVMHVFPIIQSVIIRCMHI